MKTNVAACTSIGSYFYPQLGRIYTDMLLMYREASSLISQAVQEQGMSHLASSCAQHNTDSVFLGEIAAKTPKVRSLKTIKKEKY